MRSKRLFSYGPQVVILCSLGLFLEVAISQLRAAVDVEFRSLGQPVLAVQDLAILGSVFSFGGKRRRKTEQKKPLVAAMHEAWFLSLVVPDAPI